ncbi:hypothetical protein ACS0TY_032399 [Phlomoides rotata]
MLSTEHPPPDLCQNSQLKSVSSDEKTCDDNQHLFQLDLSADDNNPLPNFSIRDYVSNTRIKDIKNSWPFSQKNLQLCLKHGVKDVLPPFQSLDSVRNQTIVEENLRDSDEKVSELSDQSVLEKLTVDTETKKSVADKEFPSTVTTQACSDINSILPTKSPCSEPEAVILPASPIEKPEFAVRGPNKVESNIQNPVKKCRLVVKLNNIPEPKSNEDLAVNTPVVSETMASKVCPVCKTFSSSSNTTLNAHIDQCLSDDTPIKRTENPKVIKHRIKPRKTKLLMDVYKTALPCTLEDLDKRNGTNWSPNRGPQPDDLEEACAEEEKKTNSSVNTENIDQDDAVYIDSNGTKLRILSKLSHPPNVNNDPGPSKFVKRDVGKKLLPIKKKKHLVQKYKPQKHSLDGQGSCSPDSDNLLDNLPHGSNSSYNGLEVDIGQQKSFHSEGNKEGDPTQPLVASDQMKYDDFGMIKRWVGSKRTGLKKKTNLVHENQHPDESMKNLRVKSVSSLGDTTLSKGSTSSKSPVSSGEIAFAPTENRKRKDTLLCNSQDGFIGPSRLRKRPAFPLLASQHSSDKNKQLMFSKFNVKHSSKVPSSTENHSPRCNKQMGISSNPHIQDDSSFIRSNVSQHHGISSEGKKFASLRKPSSGHTTSSGNKKFSSLRTKLLSVRHASVAESKKNSGRKLLNIKNTRLHSASDSDEEEAFVSRSVLHRQNNMVETLGGRATLHEKDSGQPPINRTRVLKIQKKVGRVWNTGEGDTTSNESDSYSGGKNVPIDTSNVVEEEADEMMDEFAPGPTYGMTDGEAFASFSKSLDSAYPGLADSSNIECGSHYYNGHSPDELVLNGDQDNVGAEMDADEGQGNYFVDVDPIPIPGPPGSFLPSPGRMETEELQGHSSLTTCRLQSSEEGHGVVDMDSSDSPVSGISGVSNSIAGRSNSISINNLSHFQRETQCDISVGGSGQVASEDRELNLLESRPDLMSPEMTHEARNIQLCCCARKDGSLQGSSLNFQDSQILRRRTMTSPADALKNEIHCLNMGPGTLSEKGPTSEPEKHAANSYPPSPSTPNPVLRLMGKNLMVVNKDDNSSPRTMPIQSSTAMDHLILRPCAENGQNELNSFHHNLSQGPSTFDNLQQHFEFNSSDGFKIPANHGPPQLSTPMYPSRNFAGSVASRCLGLANGFNRIADQLGSKIRLDSRTIYGAERVVTGSSGGKHKDVIVIDDSPETEAGGSVRAAAPSLALHNNPFYSYQTRVYPHFNGSTVVPNGNNTITSPSKGGMAANLGKWNIPEGNSNSSTAPLPSTVHLRSSSVYFSPGFHERERA